MKVCKGPAAMHAFVDHSSAAAHLASIAANCAAHKATVAPVEACVCRTLLDSLKAGKGAPVSVRSVERGASAIVYLEEDGALVVWEAEGAPRLLVDGDAFFRAQALCGTLDELPAAGSGVSADVFKLMRRGLSYTGAMAAAVRERERRLLSSVGQVPSSAFCIPHRASIRSATITQTAA